jgi:nucleoside-diphosphate-sugar epimerase
MKILITGGSGFIGTNLVEKFISDGYEVLNLDIAKPQIKKFENCWKKIDITEFDTFKLAVNTFQPDYIVHLAARTDLNGGRLEDYSTNTLGVKNLMKISSGLQSLKKILITSSMLVCELGYHPNDELDFMPSTVYGESKVMTEKLVRENPPLCDWAILRPTSIWGPWFQAPYRNFFEMIRDKRYFHIGRKGCIKTYGYVGNTIYQIEQILFTNTLNQINRVFYLGDYKETNIEIWANRIGDEFGVSIQRIPYLFFKILAIIGDWLKFINIYFPMTSFRLKNMTTDNRIDLRMTQKIAPDLPISEKEGIKETIIWLNNRK